MRFNLKAILKHGLKPISLSWRLSDGLLHPKEHPLAIRGRRYGTRDSVRVLGGILIGLISCSALALFTNLSVSGDFFFFFGFFTVSTGMMLAWMTSLAAGLAYERENQVYETMSLTPGGTQSVDWAFCVGRLNRSGTRFWLYEIRLTLVLIFILLVLMHTLSQISFTRYSDSGFMILLGFFTYFDQVQALVLAALTGMFVPHFTRSGFDARLWSAGLFLVSQLFPFLLASWIDQLLFTSQHDETLGLLGGMLAFYACREGIINLLWWRLNIIWNTNPDEV